MKEEKKDILEQPDWGVGTARGALAKLFRTILKDLKIGGPEWERHMQRALDDPRGPAPRNSKDRSTLKGNWNKALKADRMSWKTFQQALRLLSPVSARFEVQLTWLKGTTTIHYINQEIGGFRQEDFNDEDIDQYSALSDQVTAQLIPKADEPMEMLPDIKATFQQIERFLKPKQTAAANVRRPQYLRPRNPTH